MQIYTLMNLFLLGIGIVNNFMLLRVFKVFIATTLASLATCVCNFDFSYHLNSLMHNRQIRDKIKGKQEKIGVINLSGFCTI